MIATEEHVTKQILFYSWAMVVTTLVLVPASGVIYSAITIVAGAWFLLMAHQLYRSVRGGAQVKPLRLFLQSNNYLRSFSSASLSTRCSDSRRSATC